MKTMLERGWLGEKAGSGFYRKDGKQIRVLDWKTLEYRDRRTTRFPSVEAAASLADPAARLRQVMDGHDKGAELLSRVLTATALYAAGLVPEIADDFAPSTGPWSGIRLGCPPFRASSTRSVSPRWRSARAPPGGRASPRGGAGGRGTQGLLRRRGGARPPLCRRPAGGEGPWRAPQEEPGREPRRPRGRRGPRGVPLQDEHPGRRRHRDDALGGEGGGQPIRRPRRGQPGRAVLGRRQPDARAPRRPGGGVGRARHHGPALPGRQHGPQVRRGAGGGGALRPRPRGRLRDQPPCRARAGLGRDLHGAGGGRRRPHPRRRRDQGDGPAGARARGRRGRCRSLPVPEAGVRDDRLRPRLDVGAEALARS